MTSLDDIARHAVKDSQNRVADFRKELSELERFIDQQIARDPMTNGKVDITKKTLFSFKLSQTYALDNEIIHTACRMEWNGTRFIWPEFADLGVKDTAGDRYFFSFGYVMTPESYIMHPDGSESFEGGVRKRHRGRQWFGTCNAMVAEFIRQIVAQRFIDYRP